MGIGELSLLMLSIASVLGTCLSFIFFLIKYSYHVLFLLNDLDLITGLAVFGFLGALYLILNLSTNILKVTGKVINKLQLDE